MQLDDLCVFHLAKANGKPRLEVLASLSMSFPGTFHLDTCQRWLWICNFKRLNTLHRDLSPMSVEGVDIHRGQRAYLFLLRLASGLESEVIGETDVFGQFKEAWRKAEQLLNSFSTELAPWMHRIFEDTKEIRTRYLQNLGGSSYGSLLRKLIKDQQNQKKSILLVGAGQIAQSVAPFLLDSELILMNRNPERLSTLYRNLSQRPRARVRKLELTSQVEQICEFDDSVLQDVSHIVMCIPTDVNQDLKRVNWLKERASTNRVVIHLGGIREHCGSWNTLPQFYCLSDLFKLQTSLGNVRSVQVSYADKACEERAKLRSLGTSLSIPHCWEDLAVFA